MPPLVHPIDPAEPSVARRLLRLQRAAYRLEADLIGFDGIPPLHETLEDLMSSGLSWRAAREEGEIAGAVAFTVEDGVCDIDRLMVDPGHHRRGLATMLIISLMEYDRITVATGTGNEPALLLYRSLGFTEAGIREVAPGVTVTRLEWARPKEP